MGVEEENGVAKRPVTGIPTNQLDKIQREMLQYNQLIESFYAPRISMEDVDGQDVLVIWVPSGINRPYIEIITSENPLRLQSSPTVSPS